MIAMVTGAAGFLGGFLWRALLQAGHKVRGVDRTLPEGDDLRHPSMTWIRRDLSLEGLTLADIEGVEVLFHLAGATLGAGGDESFFLTVNETTLVNVLKTIAGRVNKIIHASSQVVYGNINSLNIDENFPLNGYDSAYACSKLNCENWLKWFHKKNGGVIISLRFTGFIEGGGAIDYFISQALKNEPIEVYSMGEICRDYLSVHDGIQAFQAAAAADFDGGPHLSAYNIGSGEQMTTLELAKLVCAELGSDSKVVPVPKAAPRANFVFNIAKAREEVGFKPQPLAEAVKNYVRETAKRNGKEL